MSPSHPDGKFYVKDKIPHRYPCCWKPVPKDLKGQRLGNQLKSDQIRVKIQTWGKKCGSTDEVLAMHSGSSGFDPYHLRNQLDMASQTCNPSSGEMGRRIRRSRHSSLLVESEVSFSNVRLCLKTRQQKSRCIRCCSWGRRRESVGKVYV